MSDADKYMDESFRKMSEEFKVSYDKSFWEEAKAKLENDSLDSAFREAAAQFSAASIGGMELASESLSDAFMDEAFKEAASKMSVTYDAAYWSQMEANQANLQMDDAFHTASKELKASYNPAFWGDADIALQQEGLHYEYDSAYWNEAKELLDKADRKSFFRRWAAAAVLLLLISFAGVNSGLISNFADSFKNGKATHENGENGLAIADHHGAASDELTDNSNGELVTAEVLTEDETSLNEPENNHLAEVNQNGNNLVAEEDATNLENNQVVEENQDVAPQENENSDVVVEENGTEADDNENSSNNADRQIRNEDRSNDNDTENGLTEDIQNSFSPIDIDQRPDELVVSPENNIADENNLVAEELDMNPRFLTPVNRTLSPIRLNHNSLEIPNNSLMEVGSLRPVPVHTISVFGGIGRGNSYGFEEFVAATRYAGGLEYTFDGLGKRSRLELGASFSINYSSHENLRFSFNKPHFADNGDVENYWVNVIFNDLYYFNSNFHINYKFFPKHKLKLGIGMANLVSARSNMTSKENKFIGLEIENNNWGVQEGLAKSDLIFSLGYEFKISREFAVQVNGSYGLLDRTNEEYFNDYPTFDNEMNVMVGLKYNLFRGIR